MKIDLLDLAPRRYAYLRHLGPYPEIGASFGRMAGIAGSAGLLGTPDALFVGVYFDDPSSTPPERLRSDAGVTVSEGAAIPARLEEGRLAGGRYAKGVHMGSYANMTESWGAFMTSIDASGAKPRMEPPFELYLSDMGATPEAELVAELYMAVE